MKHELARRLRRDQTDVERKLWYALRDRRFHACKFRRQQPIGPYVCDFVSFASKLVVELDGSQHALAGQFEHDEIRTRFLQRQGFRVLRFWNAELNENFDGAMQAIWLALETPPHPQRSG